MSHRRDFAASVPSVTNTGLIAAISKILYTDSETTYRPDMGGSSATMYMCNPNGCHIPNAGGSYVIRLCVLCIKSHSSQVNENYWDLTLQAILGKLYVISLFVTLCDVVQSPLRVSPELTGYRIGTDVRTCNAIR